MTKSTRKKAIIVSAAGLLILVVLVGAVLLLQTDEVLECLDRGGRWSADEKKCECTYADRGDRSTNPSPEEIRKCLAAS